MRRSVVASFVVIPVAIAVVGAAASANAQTFDRNAWMARFKKSQGWEYADGATSVSIPPASGTTTKRSLWTFGDGVIWNAGFVQPGTATVYSSRFGYGGNTMAINSGGANGWATPTTMNFYSRKKANSSTICGSDATQWTALCPIQRISLASDYTSAMQSLIAGSGGFQPSHSNGDFQWPGPGVYIAAPSFGPFYTAPPPFHPTTPEPFLALSWTRTTFSNTNANGITIITNVTNNNPANWTYKGVVNFPVNSQIALPHWGVGLVGVPGDDKIRIYGEVTNGFTKDMVLAVAWPHTDIADPTRWFYAYKDDPSVNCNGATPCRPCADTGKSSPCYAQVPPTQAHLVPQLKRVADNIWGDVSVDVICHNQPGTGGRPSQDACMFVMVHGGAFMSNGQLPATTNPDCARAGRFVVASCQSRQLFQEPETNPGRPEAEHVRERRDQRSNRLGPKLSLRRPERHALRHANPGTRRAVSAWSGRAELGHQRRHQRTRRAVGQRRYADRSQPPVQCSFRSAAPEQVPTLVPGH
jgi:hypothetical protein